MILAITFRASLVTKYFVNQKKGTAEAVPWTLARHPKTEFKKMKIYDFFSARHAWS